MNTDDFLRGQRDCKDGKDLKLGDTDDYYRGYGAQYELEQIQAHNTTMRVH